MGDTSTRLITPQFLLVSAVSLLHGLALHTYLHLPGFLSQLHATELTIGLIFGLMSGAAIVIRPFAGRVMDLRGRRSVMLAAGFLHALSCVLYLWVDHIGWFLVVNRSLQGFAEGALFSALFTYAADIVPAERRTEGMGLFGVSGLLPLGFGGLLGDFLLNQSAGDYTMVFVVSAAISGLAVGVNWFLPETKEIGVASNEEEGASLLAPLSQADLLPLFFVGSSFAMALAGGFTFMKTFVDEERIGSVGMFFTCYSLSAVALRVFFGWMPDRLGPKRVLIPSILVISLGLASLVWAHNGVWIATSGALVGLGHGFAFPILAALVVNRASEAMRGSAVAFFTAVFDMGILFGGPFLGWVIALSDLRTMFAVAAVIPVVGVCMFLPWDRYATEKVIRT